MIFVRKKKVLSLLSKDLERAGKEASIAGDRRDWDGTTEAHAKIELLQELISKIRKM